MHRKSAREIRDGFVNGQFSAVEIAHIFLKRIEALDQQVGAYLTILSERVLKQAEQLDQKRAHGAPLGKLAGVPVTIKDNMHIRDEITTCGSKFLTNYRAPFNATVVERLQAEDALLIGKANLDEFAMGSSTEYSALKKTFNPWNLAHSSGGSSGGSAAAVAARLTPIALGSDTGGSIRQPASFCGVVGFKPTYGRVSRYGLVAFGSSFDQIGPLANSVGDIGMMMEVLGHPCVNDSTSLPDEPETYLAQLEQKVKGMKVGIPWKALDYLNDEERKNFDQSLDTLQELGCEIVDVELNLLKYSIAIYYILSTAEASTNLARFDGIRYGQRSQEAQTLDEVYDLSKNEGYGPEVKRRIFLGTFVLSSGYQDAYYRKAQRVRTLVIEQYQQAFQQCDLIALPTTPTPSWRLGSIKDPLDMYLADIYTVPANLAGLPGISLPSGFSSEGLPHGLQLMGPQRADVRVCHLAHAFEQATRFNEAIPEMAKEV